MCCAGENVKLAMEADQRKQCSDCAVDASLSAAELELVPIVADEEFLPLQLGSIDLALSNLSLHWVNELQDTLGQVCLHSTVAAVPSGQLFSPQIRQALKPNGAFIAAMFGGDTVAELR